MIKFRRVSRSGISCRIESWVSVGKNSKVDILGCVECQARMVFNFGHLGSSTVKVMDES